MDLAGIPQDELLEAFWWWLHWKSYIQIKLFYLILTPQQEQYPFFLIFSSVQYDDLWYIHLWYIHSEMITTVKLIYSSPHIVICISQPMETVCVSVDWWMDKENVLYICVCNIYICIHNGILFSHKKRRNPVICNNMDETGGYYTNKITRQRKTYTVWYCLYVESPQKIRFIETENRLVVTKSWSRKRGDVGLSGQRIQISSHKMNKFWGSDMQYGDYSLALYCILEIC